MVADLLDHVLVEVTGVSLETITNLEGVLHAIEDGASEVINKATLAELEALLLHVTVNALNPGVVITSGRLVNVILELDDVRIRDGLGINGVEDGSRAVVDGLDGERGSLGDSGHGESERSPHGETKKQALANQWKKDMQEQGD